MKTTSTNFSNGNTLTKWEALLQSVANNPRDGENVEKLSRALAFSVLRKTLDPQRHGQTEAPDGVPSNSGQSPVLRKMKADIHNGEKLSRTLTKSHAMQGGLKHNKNGDTEYESSTEVFDYSFSINEWYGDGMELVQTASLAIMEELRKQAERDPGKPFDLTREYTARVLRKRIRIKEETPEAWEEIVTTPIQEAFRAVRRAILNNKHVSIDPRNGYLYISELVKDTDTGEEEEVYNRLPKYWDIGTDGQEDNDPYIPGSPAGIDGRAIYSADSYTAKDTADYISMLNLSNREAVVMRHRMQGHGKRAIATAMGVRADNVKVMQKRIQAKAKKIGLIAEAETEESVKLSGAEMRVINAREAVKKVTEAEARTASPENIFKAREARANLERIASRAEEEARKIANHIRELIVDGKKKEQKQAEKALEIEMQIAKIARSV